MGVPHPLPYALWNFLEVTVANLLVEAPRSPLGWDVLHALDYCLGRMANALPDIPWPLGRLIVNA